MTTTQDTRLGDVDGVYLPPAWFPLDIAAGTENPNCLCLDEHHRTPGCPQHPGGEGR